MPAATLILPHQLFSDHPALQKARPVYLLEEQLFFRDFNYPARFHKKKLLLHVASMRHYANGLENKGYDVRYIQHDPGPGMDNLFERLKKDGITKLVLADPVDYMVDKRLQRLCTTNKVALQYVDSPGFLCSSRAVEDYFKDRKTFRQTEFYRELRREHGMLMDGGKPQGGKWTFDTENRRKLPQDIAIPGLPEVPRRQLVDEEAGAIDTQYADHPGSTEDFIYPVTREDALVWLDDFLENRLRLFGEYQDAMAHDGLLLFHSLLSPSLNSGLLTPQEILDRTVEFAADGRRRIPLNSLEGFVRQILGWREFMRGMYAARGVGLRNGNFWGHDRPMPQAFYDGTTGIEPVDTVIHRVLETGYCHHIERLMVLGNFMLLCGIDPTAVYTWFMELFIDAYDWVMVPNVYGMSQFADGGIMTTKPYISSSNYILKMSNFSKGNWCATWDGLYWRFIHEHRAFFEGNPRMRVMTSHLKRMGARGLKEHLKTAESFLEEVF